MSPRHTIRAGRKEVILLLPIYRGRNGRSGCPFVIARLVLNEMRELDEAIPDALWQWNFPLAGASDQHRVVVELTS